MDSMSVPKRARERSGKKGERERIKKEVKLEAVENNHNFGTTTQPGADSGDADVEDSISRPAEDEGISVLAEDLERLAAIEESRRKLAKLEADRPLWEAARREKEAREQREAAMMKRKEEEARNERARQARELAEREARLQREREQKEKARKAKEERIRQEREQKERERSKREAKGQAQLRQGRFQTVRWSPSQALDRYLRQCSVFDTTKYSESQPLTMIAIPWPVLFPSPVDCRRIEWADVETFFNQVRPLMVATHFRGFVDKSHKRFHPDRWKSRGLLKHLKGGDEQVVEKTVNLVAQVLSPLWTSTRDQ